MRSSVIEMVFMSSNKTKLAHFRHLVDGHPISIKSFSSTYHKGYDEPRSDSREEILNRSYQSAIEQAVKAKIPLDTSFLFIEDTSVIIDGLSSEKEVPGVDVKYWMRDTTFETLNFQLMNGGGGRGTTVRSDVLLHIPRKFKKAMGISKDYLIFTGTQKGRVTQEEENIETNLLYPWLDNKTFNKWFVPNGEDHPISALPIQVADRYDFRKKAFDQVIKLLVDNHYVYEVPEQRGLSLLRYPNFMIVGPTCAGKTTLSQMLVDKYGYMHFEASDFMHLSMYMRHGIDTKINVGDFAEVALSEKGDIVANQISNQLENFSDSPIVISGFRSIDEVEVIRSNNFGICFDLVRVNAAYETRFARNRIRNRDESASDESAFRDRDFQQSRMGINDFYTAENFSEIENEGTLDEYLISFVEKFLGKNAPSEPKEVKISDLKLVFESKKIEDAILVCLLSKCEGNSCRDYFTTADIARISLELLPPEFVKHKDNVSRHFNQALYSYYEVRHSEIENKNRFRLSNTGYSLARRILRSFKS